MKLLVTILTVIVVVMIFYGLTGGNSSPIGNTFHACSVVMLPVFIVLDIIALIYWLAVRRRWLWALLPLLPLPFCWNYICTNLRFASADTSMHNNVLTVATYNVRSFSSEASGFIAQDIMTTLNRSNCDIVCLQEYRDDIPGDNNNVRTRVRNLYEYSVAGSGDMMNAMIYLAAERGIADRFHFPGFMRGKQVYECLKDSDVYVMPSVSEPFGISPLEAMQCGTPSIISKQSGCAEILDNCIKVDYWDIHALADAIYSICANESLFQYLKEEGKREVDQITWEKVGRWIRTLYRRTLGWEE